MEIKNCSEAKELTDNYLMEDMRIIFFENINKIDFNNLCVWKSECM